MKITIIRKAFGKKALKVMNMSNEKVKLVVINLFGIGIMICDR